MAAELYPTFVVDEEEEIDDSEEILYPEDYKFDFETGEFVTDSNGDIVLCSGVEAWLQWCNTVIRTERYACLSYADDIGVEIEECYGTDDREDTELRIESTIKEALLADPEGRTDSVDEFQFIWGVDSLHVVFTATATIGVAAALSADYSYNSMNGGDVDD